MVLAAQNALLKTLEEPPSSSIFILVTAQADALLPTVQSRCPRLRFRPLAAHEVAAALVARGRSARDAQAAAAMGHGSIGRALDASAEDFVEAHEIAARVLAQAAASEDPRRRLETAKDLLSKTGSGGAADRERLASHLRALASILRDVELLSTSADRRGLANPDAAPILETLTRFQGERGLHAFESVEQALTALEKNAGVKTVADWVVLQL